MAFIDVLMVIVYIIVFALTFFVGFMLVRKNLAKINRIEGEKFDTGDWFAMIAFGLMFALALVFMLNVTVEVIAQTPILSFAGVVLTTMIILLVVYPLWEIFVLGKPTSDSVHDFHKFLEAKILDRFRGKLAYVVSGIIFLVIYIIPVIILTIVTEYTFVQMGFLWFLIFPLFFLNYFSSQGQISGIVSNTYRHKFSSELLRNAGLKADTKTKAINIVFIAIAWLPFLLSFYNFANPFLKAASGYAFSEKDKMMGYISLITTVPFGIKGFFQKFWNKKSKTKTIDYVFSGYIFIAIGINMLINFVQIDQSVVNDILGSNALLSQLIVVFEKYEILVPIIVLQSFITVVFGTIGLLQTNSDFHSDVRLQTTSQAYGTLNVENIIKEAKHKAKLMRKKEKKDQADIDNLEMEDKSAGLDQVGDFEEDDKPTKKDKKGAKKEDDNRVKEEKREKKEKTKKPKRDIITLYKSLLINPVYSNFGVDLNEQVRIKAAQYLFLMAVEEKFMAKKIVDFVMNASVYPSKYGEAQEFRYISKESLDLLGEIGNIYPQLVLNKLVDALNYSDIRVQRMILDALGDIGENKENMKLILQKIKPLLTDKRTEVRTAAFQSITEMILEGQNQDKEFVAVALGSIYEVLDQEYKNPEAIDSALEALVQMSAKIADDLDLAKIMPFLKYKEGKDQELINYIIQNAITILAYMVYYNIDKFPIEEVRKFLKDEERPHIRYVAADCVGNFILKGSKKYKEQILTDLMVMSLNDEDIDVVQMCAESVAEFLVMHKNYVPTIDGHKISILDYYTNALTSKDSRVAENASEALKLISPLYDDVDIYPLLEPHLSGENPELIRDCLHVIALSDKEEHTSANLEIIYGLTRHEDASIRDKAVYTLGMISVDRPDIDEKVVIERLNDEDPQVRQEAIFALGKIGIQKPEEVSTELIRRYFEMDKTDEKNISEIELYAESLGVIGAEHPSNEIIISLQATLMGDTNPLAKDVIARALGGIGHGMIKSGKATQRIKNEAFLNQISWLKSARKKEYTVGNIVIMLIEALQLKGIPNSVMDQISDSIQDILPVFLFAYQEDEDPTDNKSLEIVKQLLAQAYYSNYNNEILETIDRIDSMISFKRSFEEENLVLKEQYIFYAKQYTPDGKQFHDQGEVFLVLEDEDPAYMNYALKSFEIAISLAPYEYYTPTCVLNMGKIYEIKGDYERAVIMFENALELYSAMDEVDMMKECEEKLSALKEKL